MIWRNVWLSLMPMYVMAQAAHSGEVFDFHQHNGAQQTHNELALTQGDIRLRIGGSDQLILTEHGLGVEDDHAQHELDAKKGHQDVVTLEFFDVTGQPLNVVVKSLRLKMFEPKVSQDKGTLVQLDGRELASLNATLNHTQKAGFSQDRHVSQSWALNQAVNVEKGFEIRPAKHAGFYVYSIEVEAMDMPPVFASVPVAQVQEGRPYLYTLDVRDEDPTAVTLALLQGPQDMVLDAEKTQLRWEPNFTAQGVYPVTIQATDAQGQASQQSFMLEVANQNQAPLFTSVPVLKAKETQAYLYKVTTLDKDQDAVFVRILEAPLGMTFDEKTQTLAWLPDYQQAGEHFIKLGASDVFDETQQAFAIHVEDTNRLPSITSRAPKQVKENAEYRYTLTAQDADQDPLTFELVHGPETLTLDEKSGQIHWHPDFLQAGEHPVKVRVHDGKQGVAEQTFAIEVNNVNRPPQFISQAKTSIHEKQFYRYRLQAQDADLSGLRFELEEGPSGMHLNADTQTLQWLPDFDDAGSYPVRISVSDGESKTEQRFKLVVHDVNRPPVWQTLAKQTLNEGDTLTLSLNASDPDKDTIEYQLLQAPAQFSLHPKTGVARWSADYQQAGLHQVWVRAVDAAGNVADTAFDVQVNNVNRAPIITSKAQQQAKETQPYVYVIQGQDADQDALRYRLITGPADMVLDEKQGVLSWQPGFNDAGEHDVVIEVSDGFSPRQQAFTLHVLNENRLPQWTSQPIVEAAETQPYVYQLAVADADQDNVFYELLSAPSGMTLNEKTAQLHWTPSYDQAGVHNVELQVTDGHSGVAKQAFSIHVANQNRAPKWLSQADTSGRENRLYRYQLQAHDEDGDRLKYRVIKAPKGVSFDPYSHTLSWLPDHRSAGRYRFEFSVSDGLATAEQAFELAVHDDNRTPRINSVAPTQVQEGQMYEYTVLASDLDTDALVYQLLQAPENMSIDPSTGRIQWQTTFEDAGHQSVEVQVSDGKGGLVTQSFALTVAEVNRPPEILSTPNTQITLGEPFRYRIQAQDADWQGLDLRLINAPKGMVLDASAQTIMWHEPGMLPGQYDVVVEVSDGKATQQQAFSVQVISPTAIAAQ